MKRLFICIICAITLNACTNLDEEIFSNISKDDFFTSEEQFVKYSARAYSSLQDWGTEKSYWTMIIELTNEVCVPINPNGSWDDKGRYKEIQQHSIDTGNVILLQGWNYCFNGIAACNDVLDMFESSDKSFAAKDRIIAEIKTLRAYYFLLAMDAWGNIPFSISKRETEYPKQKDRKSVFEFIEKELTENVELLSPVATPEYYGRMTQGAAYTLLAKLYLNAEVWVGKAMWAEAEAACKKVIDGGQYVLEDDYKANFAIFNENSREQIFSIPYSTVYTQSDHNAFNIYMSTLPADLCAPMGINTEAWDGLVAEPDFMASYESGDIRKEATWLFGQMYDKDGNPLSFEDGSPYIIDPYIPDTNLTERRTAAQGARIGKWTYQSDGKLTGDMVSMDNDFFLMRYADVVLMYVEALVRQGRESEASSLADFQKIRTRAGLSPIAASDLTLDNLYWERAHELAIEGWQRQDMIRFGKYLEAWWSKPEKQEADLLLPIPKTVLAANNNLTQNPR